MVLENIFFGNNSLNLLSWNSLLNNLYKIQNRLFKSVYVSDMPKVLAFQQLIFSSSLSRLLAVREVTQMDSKRKLPGIDGRICLTFTERFELCEYLKLHLYNWYPSLVKPSLVVNKKGDFVSLNILTVRDRCWQTLVKFCLEPTHEATFSFRSFGSRSCISVHYVQRLIFQNLSSNSFGLQKRIMFINLRPLFSNFNFGPLLNKLIITRSVKLGIFRSLNLGFSINFTEDSLLHQDLSSLLSNIVLSGIESLHPCVRFADQIIFFLKPLDNESFLFRKIKFFLSSMGFSIILLQFLLTSSLNGFDFLGWNFRVRLDGSVFSFPSSTNYQLLLLRVKHILNNSNYGAVCSSL